MRSSKSVFLVITSIYYNVCFGFSVRCPGCADSSHYFFFYLIQVISIPGLYPSVLSSFADARTRPVFIITWEPEVKLGSHIFVFREVFFEFQLSRLTLHKRLGSFPLPNCDN